MIDFIQKRFTFYTIAGVAGLISAGVMIIFPINLGIDLTGGVLAEFTYNKPVEITTVKEKVESIKAKASYEGKELINNTTAYKVAGSNTFVVEAGFQKVGNLSTKDFEQKKEDFKKALSSEVSAIAPGDIQMIRYTHIGESFGDYIKQTAIATLILLVAFISLYIAWAFRGAVEGVSSFSFAFVTATSLFHTVFVALGCYLLVSHIFSEFKVDTYFITAMLTVLGYSVSDTIVIMDRIRYNLQQKELRKLDFGDLVNASNNETLTRSLFTSLSVVLVLSAMFFFGPETIRGFVLAMLFGTIVGAYSSIAIAAPLLYDLNKKQKRA